MDRYMIRLCKEDDYLKIKYVHRKNKTEIDQSYNFYVDYNDVRAMLGESVVTKDIAFLETHLVGRLLHMRFTYINAGISRNVTGYIDEFYISYVKFYHFVYGDEREITLLDMPLGKASYIVRAPETAKYIAENKFVRRAFCKFYRDRMNSNGSRIYILYDDYEGSFYFVCQNEFGEKEYDGGFVLHKKTDARQSKEIPYYSMHT